MRIGSLVLFTASLTVLAGHVAALVEPSSSHTAKYTVAKLEVPAGASSTAFGMNNAGQVIGTAYSSQFDTFDEAAIWNGLTLSPLETPPGYALFSILGINDAGIVTGGACTAGDCVPTGWSPTAGVFLLPSPWGFAEGINDAGQIVGYSTVTGVDPNGPYFAVLWSGPDATTVSRLATVGGSRNVASGAYSINAADQIVGVSLFNDSTRHATYWHGLSGRDLGTLGGPNSQAYKINDNGYIAGWADTKSGAQHAALWRTNTAAYDLGTLGGENSIAFDINAEGDVVGTAQTAWGEWHAVLWTHKHYVAVDLNAEIGTQLGSGTMTLFSSRVFQQHRPATARCGHYGHPSTCVEPQESLGSVRLRGVGWRAADSRPKRPIFAAQLLPLPYGRVITSR